MVIQRGIYMYILYTCIYQVFIEKNTTAPFSLKLALFLSPACRFELWQINDWPRGFWWVWYTAALGKLLTACRDSMHLDAGSFGRASSISPRWNPVEVLRKLPWCSSLSMFVPQHALKWRDSAVFNHGMSRGSAWNPPSGQEGARLEPSRGQDDAWVDGVVMDHGPQRTGGLTMAHNLKRKRFHSQKFTSLHRSVVRCRIYLRFSRFISTILLNV